jgi:hypothetical protein
MYFLVKSSLHLIIAITFYWFCFLLPQLDYYGAAATIHCLLFSKYMNVTEVRGRWMPTCKPKRYAEFLLYGGRSEKFLEPKNINHEAFLRAYFSP